MKIFMQKIWLRGLDWDSPLDDDLKEQWQNIYVNMLKIREIQIPWWLQYSDRSKVQLHGFADASELAYAAVIYLKVIRDNGVVTTRIVASKTKVAPVKQVTLPRLELCACHLLTRLLVKVKVILNLGEVEVYGWTDSTIVLAWLAEHPRKWKNFVANRTSYIIDNLPSHHWYHIASSQNPADIASRGVLPHELKQANLWWEGPKILNDMVYNRKVPVLQECPELEIKNKKVVLHVVDSQQGDILNRYSSLDELLRITALLCRFCTNCKLSKDRRNTGFLTTLEIRDALSMLIRKVQEEHFKTEIRIISSNRQLPNNHKLTSLNPFLDNKNLLRVGGRLDNANVSYDQKHPVILHKDSRLTELIVRYYHAKYLHAGHRQLFYLIGLKYCIPSIIYIIKRCVYKCTRCMRYRNKNFEQQMGNLPKYRLETVLPFQNVGTDFAGPLNIRAWKGRGSKVHKCWLAIFICLSTKAMHLEVVTELSTDAFIASLRRFVSRRGKPSHIYSDNGTNFVGCNQKLKNFVHFMLASKTQEKIAKETSDNGIQWHFTPPFGPHFGGIWEAGVKSVKFHLHRVLGNTSLTYEELSTVLCQIESCLNSRPLTAKFEGDTDPLTTSHFLLFKSTQTVPDEELLNINMNRLTRWQYLQQLLQGFWKKWSISYLSQLQTRPNWKIKTENLKKDDIVIIKDDLLPPNKWLIARVLETHPGHDGLIRVVTLKTHKGTYKRPISKICPLIIDY